MLPLPRLTAKDIVSVQPMTAPVGHIFYLDYTYGKQPNLNNDIFTLKPMLATTTLDQIKSIKVQNCDSVQELLENLSKLHELITQKYQSGTWFTDEELEWIGSKLVLGANFGTKKVVSSAEDQEKISDKLLEIENFFYDLPYSFFFDHSGTEEANERNKEFERMAIEVTNRSIVRPNNATIESKILSDFTGIQYKFLRYHSLNQEVGLAYFQVQNFLKNHGVFCSSLMLFELARDFTTRYENKLKIQAYKDEAVFKNKKEYPVRVSALKEPIKVVKESNMIGLITCVLHHYESMLHSPDPYTLSVHHKALREYLEQVNLMNFKPCVSIDYYIAQTYILVQLMNEDLKSKKFDKRKELGDCVAKFLKTVPSTSNNNDEFVTRDTSEIEMAVELLKQNWTNYELVYKEHVFNQIQEELTQKMNDPKTNFNDLRKQQKELMDKHFSKEEQKELMAEVFANRQAEKDVKELFENIKKVNEQILKTTVKSVDKPIQLTFDFAEPIKLESVPVVATKKKLNAKWEITNVLSFSDLKKQINSLELTQDVIQPSDNDKIKLPYLKPTLKSVQQILPLLESIKYHKELFVTEVMDKEKGDFAIQKLYSFLVFSVWDDYPKIEKLVLQILEQRELEALARQAKVPTFDNKPKKHIPSVEAVKEEYLEVAYRLAAKQLLQLGRQFLSQQFNQQNRTVALQFLSSEWGTAVVASFILTMLADKFPQKHLDILSKELRVSTLALVGNDTVDLFKETLSKLNLPEETCKTVPVVLEQTHEEELVYESRGISNQQ